MVKWLMIKKLVTVSFQKYDSTSKKLKMARQGQVKRRKYSPMGFG